MIPGTGENSAVLQDIRGAAMESSKPDGWADRQKAAGKDERAAVKEERRNRKMHCPRCGAGDVYLINGKMKCHGCGYEEGKLF